MRAGLRVAGLILLFFACLLPHLIAKWLGRRSAWPQRFLAAAAWICGADVRMSGAPIRPHCLLVANHTSWLDILILGGSTGCAFVSKDALGHGLLHWLADQNQTVYVRREHRKGAKNQAVQIARALERDNPIALFPEGTTGPGDELLPFRSTLLEAAAYADKTVEIRPVAIDFGPFQTEVGWWHEPGKDNVLRILGRRGRLPVTVRLLDPVPHLDRKTLATHARTEIANALAASDSRDARL
ncbi:MAG TPA: lysophospholipid acyltransferase family protein [Sphingomicrobium sp.]|nr:lysophospholipid acyltransferase family protein [Sphingomicrobium sp.]